MTTLNVSKFTSKILLLSILMLFVVFCVTIIFDFAILREVFGFLYLTFIPGFIFLNLLNVNKFKRSEILFLSIGLSVAFLMICGLLINEILPIFKFSQPLSLFPLLIFLNIPVLIGCVLLYIKNKNLQIWENDSFKFSAASLIFLFLPIISIIGTKFVNVNGNNLFLLFLIILIAILVVLSVFSQKLLPSDLYPFALLMIGISLLFHSSLISSYIVPFGSDIPGEFLLFQNTLNDFQWNQLFSPSMGYTLLNTYNNMLSITILPTVYSTLLNIDSFLMFKVLYPLIFSLIPLVLYQVWQYFIDKKYAFIAAFFFMAQNTFYTEMLGLSRQIIAELFFVLLLFIILHKNIKPITKMICFVVFSFGLVTAHYSLALIFLFFISATLVFYIITKRPTMKISITMVLIFFVIMFTWYIYTSGSASFITLMEKGEFVVSMLGDFFNPASRGDTVLTGLGLAESPSIFNTISRIIAYVLQGFIIVGFLGLVTNLKKIRTEFFVFGIIATLFLGMLIIIPGLANTLNMTRFYHILLFFLAPLCILGARLIVKLITKRQKEFAVCALLLFVLVPYFFFQTNFVYEITGNDSWSIPLSGYRMDPLRLYGHSGYTDEYSVHGVRWLSKNVNFTTSVVYADDRTGTNVLTIHGLIATGKVALSNVTVVADNGFVYLSSLNVIYGLIPYRDVSWNTTELSPVFEGLNLVYSNGGSKIYVNTP